MRSGHLTASDSNTRSRSCHPRGSRPAGDHPTDRLQAPNTMHPGCPAPRMHRASSLLMQSCGRPVYCNGPPDSLACFGDVARPRFAFLLLLPEGFAFFVAGADPAPFGLPLAGERSHASGFVGFADQPRAALPFAPLLVLIKIAHKMFDRLRCGMAPACRCSMSSASAFGVSALPAPGIFPCHQVLRRWQWADTFGGVRSFHKASVRLRLGRYVSCRT